MLPWPKNPRLYEINTWTWLHALSARHGEPITLGSVPDAALDELARWGFDAVWLMGVWERSPRGRSIALEHKSLQAEYTRALADWKPEDVVGSPYAIHRYVVDPHLGDRGELATLRERLAARGMRLILDFVPNHVALDHPWVEAHPEYFVHGTLAQLEAQPDHFFQGPRGHIIAHGRDPLYPAWTDTAQLNALNPALRQRVVVVLQELAAQCDGVRCDMAMLVANRVFAQTWGSQVLTEPGQEFWEVVIPAVKEENPNFLFMAEVYWDMEWELLQQGFDYAYDKRLYDRLIHESARVILAHLHADLTYQEHLVRFIENHDERRAPDAFGPGRDLAAAVLVVTLPGATLIHDGQMAGPKVRLPVQLRRRPAEPVNPAVEAFYRALLGQTDDPVYHEGRWQLREAGPAWDLNASHRSLIAYTWQRGQDRRLVVVNYSATPAQGRVQLPDLDVQGRLWRLHDGLNDADYERSGNEMAQHGLYVDLGPWKAHIFSFTCTGDCPEEEPAEQPAHQPT